MLRTLLALPFFACMVACAPQGPEPASEPTSETPAAPVADATGIHLPLLLPLPDSTTPAITPDDLAVRIKTLADDAFEGRAPASEKGEQAADWIAAEMQRLGLEPGGPDGSWFQTVEMIEQTLDEAASSLTFTGGASGEPFPVMLREDSVMWTKHQDQLSIDFADSDLVFVGYGVVAPEYGWNDYAGLDARGKTVVMLVNDPGYALEGELFKGKAMTYYGRWTYKFEEAARQGATGAIIVHETAPASYGWDVVANSWSGALADLSRTDAGASRAQFESWITEETARSLFAEADLNFSDMKRAAKTQGFMPVEMGNLQASGKIVQTITKTASRNVLGILPGSTAPDEYMLFTAHWDHLGKKTEERAGEQTQDFYRDDIFNGAVDNATGTAAMLEIAEAMAAEERDRSALFLAVTLEESGLLGSAYYAENPTVPMNKIVAGINIDAMQPVGKTKDVVVIGYGASELEDMLAAYLAEDDRVIQPDPSPQAGMFYRSDQMSFTRKGVPMLWADNGQDKLEGGTAAGRAFGEVYSAQRYHKPMDEYTNEWDLSGMSQDITALFKVGREVIQSDTWPTWYPGNEFEAIRQMSLAEGNQVLLSYQHGYHAGNRADILKHAVLHAVLSAEAKQASPIFYIETHAARGIYDLTGKQARKTGESELGVLAMPEAAKSPHALQPWLSLVQAAGPKAYPGSPALAVTTLPKTSRFVFFEKHPKEYAELNKNLGSDARVQIKKADGYSGALRLQPRRGETMLVLLDPSYETTADMEALANWLPRAMRRWPKAKFLIWLPLFADGREDDFGAFLSELDTGFVAGSRWARHSQDPSALEGSAMIGLRIEGSGAKQAFAIAAELDKLWEAA